MECFKESPLDDMAGKQYRSQTKDCVNQTCSSGYIYSDNVYTVKYVMNKKGEIEDIKTRMLADDLLEEMAVTSIRSTATKPTSGWVQHLNSPAKKVCAPKIRIEVETTNSDGYTVFEEKWIDDPKV